MSRHRRNGDDQEKPRPGRRDHDGLAPDGRRDDQDFGGGANDRADGHVDGHVDGRADARVNGRFDGGVNGRINGSARNGSPVNGSPAHRSAADGPVHSGPAANGSAANGSAAHPSAANGSVPSGPAANGSAANGSATNGPAANGPAANGSAVYGSMALGSTSNGSTTRGSAVNDPAAYGSGTTRAAANGAVANGSAVNGSAVNGSVVNGSAANSSIAHGRAINGTAAGSPAAGRSTVEGSAADGPATSSPAANGSVRNGRSRPTPRPRDEGPSPGGNGRRQRRRSARAQPSSIADFARSDRNDGPRGRDAAGSPAAGLPGDTTRIPAAPDRDGAERTAWHGVAVPTQRDRSDDGGPHRTTDRTATLPPRTGPAAVPEPRRGTTPSAAPESRPGSTPQAAPEPRPRTTPSAAPEPRPRTTPSAVPEPRPRTTPPAAPEPRRGTTPSAVPEPGPGSTPPAGPEPRPGTTPSATPERRPGTAPQAVPVSRLANVPGPRPAPARSARDGLAPGAPGRTDEPAGDAAPTTRVPAARPAVEPGDQDTALRTPALPADRGTAAPSDRRTADRGIPLPAGPDTTDREAAVSAARPDADRAPATTVAPAGSAAPPTSNAPVTDRPDATSSGNRLLGVDVARGVALFGIIAVHALVEGTDDGAPATNYLVFGGRSAALFALLAGVALAFMTGRKRVRRGRGGFGAAAAMVAARAGVLLVIGLALGWTDPEIAAVILPYYAIMFLLAVPLLLLSTGVLAGLTVVLVGAVPVLSQLVRPGLPVPTLDNPHLVDLVTDPLGLLSELTVTGAYPAATWLAYLAAGLVIGRLRLSSARTAWTLLGAGATAALAAAGASWWLLGPAGGYAHIAAATPPAQLDTAPTIADFVSAFPDGVTPTTTWWWLATIAPHSGTPLDLVQTIGSATAVLGAALLLAGIARPAVARPLGYLLRPVAAAGSMTLTLYVTSLLFMNSPLDDFGPLEGYLWQIGAALVIGTAWRRAVGRGPLEAATSTVAKAARDRVRRGRTRDRVGDAGLTGPSVADPEARR